MRQEFGIGLAQEFEEVSEGREAGFESVGHEGTAAGLDLFDLQRVDRCRGSHQLRANRTLTQ